jgi:predicted secreted Zn-dependent protease
MKTSSTNRTFNLCILLAFGLAFWPVAARSQTITCGQIVTNSITAAGQTNLYTLVGNTGDVIRLTSVPISGSVEPDIAVFNHSWNEGRWFWVQ